MSKRSSKEEIQGVGISEQNEVGNDRLGRTVKFAWKWQNLSAMHSNAHENNLDTSTWGIVC